MNKYGGVQWAAIVVCVCAGRRKKSCDWIGDLVGEVEVTRG